MTFPRDYGHRRSTKTSMRIIIKYPRETIHTLNKKKIPKFSCLWNIYSRMFIIGRFTVTHFSEHKQLPYPMRKTNCRERKKKLKRLSDHSPHWEKIMLCGIFCVIRNGIASPFFLLSTRIFLWRGRQDNHYWCLSKNEKVNTVFEGIWWREKTELSDNCHKCSCGPIRAKILWFQKSRMCTTLLCPDWIQNIWALSAHTRIYIPSLFSTVTPDPACPGWWQRRGLMWDPSSSPTSTPGAQTPVTEPRIRQRAQQEAQAVNATSATCQGSWCISNWACSDTMMTLPAPAVELQIPKSGQRSELSPDTPGCWSWLYKQRVRPSISLPSAMEKLLTHIQRFHCVFANSVRMCMLKLHNLLSIHPSAVWASLTQGNFSK